MTKKAKKLTKVDQTMLAAAAQVLLSLSKRWGKHRKHNKREYDPSDSVLEWQYVEELEEFERDFGSNYDGWRV
jgi:hypothetical protein